MRLPVRTQVPSLAMARDASLARLRVKTRGKRALSVSNRNDPELEEMLRRTSDRGNLAARRLEPRSRRLRVGEHQVRWSRPGPGATGFLPHKADSVLKSVCITADAKYVRVDRGRPQAYQRHLMLEFGGN